MFTPVIEEGDEEATGSASLDPAQDCKTEDIEQDLV